MSCEFCNDNDSLGQKNIDCIAPYIFPLRHIYRHHRIATGGGRHQATTTQEGRVTILCMICVSLLVSPLLASRSAATCRSGVGMGVLEQSRIAASFRVSGFPRDPSPSWSSFDCMGYQDRVRLRLWALMGGVLHWVGDGPLLQASHGVAVGPVSGLLPILQQ